MNRWKVIAIDADDTLWDCQSHFERVEQQLYALIAPYCADPAAELYATESGNMADLGYGCKAFTISIVETALRVGGAHVSTAELSALLAACKALLHLPATPLPGVRETLARLHDEAAAPLPPAHGQPAPCRIVCFTKGELQDQENKLRRSGLLPYFDDVEITSDKGQREFLALCEHQQCHPSELLMVGNSLKSDIAPALAVGAWAVHIPFHVTWQLEHTADFDHPRLRKAATFSDLLGIVLGIVA